MDDGDLAVVPLGVELLDVSAVEENFAFYWVVETLQKRDNAGLATATSSTECHYSVLLVVHGEADAAEDGSLRLARVVELNIANLEFTVDFSAD